MKKYIIMNNEAGNYIHSLSFEGTKPNVTGTLDPNDAIVYSGDEIATVIESLGSGFESVELFNEYTVTISKDPSYYGTDVDDEHAAFIADRLSGCIMEQFTGININIHRGGEKSSSTTGPDDSVCDEINRWIENNWTAAL